MGTGAELVNPASGKCLTDPAGRVANGTRVRIGSCTGRPSGKWALPAGPLPAQIPGKCLDDSGNGTANGNPVDLRSCDGTAAQAWQAEPDATVRVHGMVTCAAGDPGMNWRVR